MVRNHLIGAGVAIVAASLWVLLAWRTPTSTHHFAPLVVAWSYGYAGGAANPGLTALDRLRLAIGGFLVAFVAQFLLAATDKLLGPPLVEAIPVRFELTSMAAIGAVLGARPWLLGRGGVAEGSAR